ncbi:MAG: hypothetical protein QF537_13445 [SAR324 cluster bacterium]|jgi:hypothetical protein|nr:hypothetical protein [SAR324 cluster bacterium]
MLTDKEIEEGKKVTQYSLPPYHEHNDCIRIAYEWLDGKEKTKYPSKRCSPLKHIIEHWAWRYVSRTDIEVAATLHPDVHGQYPHYNISVRRIDPPIGRLDGIGEAFTQMNYCKKDPTSGQGSQGTEQPTRGPFGLI